MCILGGERKGEVLGEKADIVSVRNRSSVMTREQYGKHTALICIESGYINEVFWKLENAGVFKL